MTQQSTLIREKREITLNDWREKEKKALELLQITGALRFDRSIELVFFREDIYDARPSEVLHLHRVARNYMDKAIPVDITLEVARGIQSIKDIPAALLDIGKLASEWMQFESSFPDIQSFIGSRLGQVIQSPNPHLAAKDVILYGFGRIGRIAARRIISTTGQWRSTLFASHRHPSFRRGPIPGCVQTCGLLLKDSSMVISMVLLEASATTVPN